MSETATRAEAPERAAPQPVNDSVQNFAPPEKSTTWSDVANQCWSDMRSCPSAIGKALSESLGFGNSEKQKELEETGVLPKTRINEGTTDGKSPGFTVEWGEKPLQRNTGDRRNSAERQAEGEEGSRPRLELVKKQGEQPVPASGKRALDPVTDPAIINDVGRRPDGKPIVPTYIGVDNAASYKGSDGKKHIASGVPAWLDQPVARAFVMMNEKLAEKGKRVILASEGDSRDGAINSAGRTHTQQAIATGIHAPAGRSEHEKGRGLDVRNYQDPDVKAALKEFGFVQGNLSRPGVPIKGDAWHFSFNPKAEPDIERRFGERQARGGREGPGKTDSSPGPRPTGNDADPPTQERRSGRRDRTGERERTQERERTGERNRPDVKVESEGELGKVYEMKLDHNTGRHKVDAAVIVPKGYDPEKPTRMLIYNHGFRTDAHRALDYSELRDQMKSADPQTILVVPEWQANPGSESSARGRSDQPGFYKGMLNEIMQKTPELQGKTVDNLDSIGIIAHSAGYSPAMAQLYNNGLKDKINSVTVLDSMYNQKAYDGWITDNLQDLAAGRKHFQLIYTGHLANQSLGLQSRVERQLASAGLGTDSVYKDHKRGGELASPEAIAQHGFVFKRSEYTTKGDGAHGAMTHVYLRQLLNAEKRNRR